jgi:RimJ/RimL family protein N-acetyltransferase
MTLPKADMDEARSVANEFGQPVGFSMEDWTPPPMPLGTSLIGRYCQLEPLNSARHAQDFWNAMSDDPKGSTWTYMPFGPFASFDDLEQWSVEAERSSDTQFYVVIDEGHAAGFVAYTHIQPTHGVLELGVYFSPRLARTRVATEAFYLMIANAFQLGFRRLEWRCDSYNKPSRGAATRLGFTYEGHFRQAQVRRGRNCDTAWFSMIDCDWNAGLKGAYERWLESSNFDDRGQQKLKLSELTAPFVDTKA